MTCTLLVNRKINQDQSSGVNSTKKMTITHHKYGNHAIYWAFFTNILSIIMQGGGGMIL